MIKKIFKAIIYPLEVIKTRMALRKTGEGFMGITSNMWRNEGILGFYKVYLVIVQMIYFFK
jgi:hypothetical protein